MTKNYIEFNKLGKKWAKELEMQKPENCSEQDFAEFCGQNKNHLKDIENFILIVNDWIEQTLENMK